MAFFLPGARFYLMLILGIQNQFSSTCTTLYTLLNFSIVFIVLGTTTCKHRKTLATLCVAVRWGLTAFLCFLIAPLFTNLCNVLLWFPINAAISLLFLSGIISTSLGCVKFFFCLLFGFSCYWYLCWHYLGYICACTYFHILFIVHLQVLNYSASLLIVPFGNLYPLHCSLCKKVLELVWYIFSIVLLSTFPFLFLEPSFGYCSCSVSNLLYVQSYLYYLDIRIIA